MATSFDQKAVLHNYLERHGATAEDVLERHLDEQAEAHFGDDGFGSDEVNCADALFAMVRAGEVIWKDPPGGDGGGTKPLIYRLRDRKEAPRGG